MQVQSPGQEIPWRRKWQPSAVFSWKTPWTEEPGGLQSKGLERAGPDWVKVYTHMGTLERLYYFSTMKGRYMILGQWKGEHLSSHRMGTEQRWSNKKKKSPAVILGQNLKNKLEISWTSFLQLKCRLSPSGKGSGAQKQELWHRLYKFSCLLQTSRKPMWLGRGENK